MMRLVSRLLRYLRLYRLLFIANFNSVLIYRINGLLMGFAPIFWLVTVFAFNLIIFGRVNNLGGWTFWQINLLTGIHELLFVLSWMFFRVNFDNLVDQVRTGSLDQLLLKPVNTRFLISFKEVDFTSSLSFLNVVILIVVSWTQVIDHLTILTLAGFLAYLLIAFILSYFVFFVTSVFTLFLVGSHALSDLVGPLTEFDRYPAEIYSPGLRRFLTYGLPILFFAYMPTAYLLGKVDFRFIPVGIILIVVFFLLSRLAWSKSLKRYSSASS